MESTGLHVDWDPVGAEQNVSKFYNRSANSILNVQVITSSYKHYKHRLEE